MESVKLGDVELEILTYIGENPGVYSPLEMTEILHKSNISYVSRPFNTLKAKGILEEVANKTHKGKGRPAKHYQLTSHGVISLCLHLDPIKRLEVMKKNLEFPIIMYMHAYYSGLKNEKYEHADQFLEDSFSISLFLIGSKRFDIDEIDVMNNAWVNQRLKKFTGRRRDRFDSYITKFAVQHDINKKKKRMKKQAKKLLLG